MCPPFISIYFITSLHCHWPCAIHLHEYVLFIIFVVFFYSLRALFLSIYFEFFSSFPTSLLISFFSFFLFNRFFVDRCCFHFVDHFMAIAFINCWLLGVNDFFKWTKFRTFFLFFLFASLNNTVFNKEKLFVASVSVSVFLLLWFAESLSVSWNFKRKERNEFLSFIFLFAYLLFIPTDKCNIYCYFFPSVLR